MTTGKTTIRMTDGVLVSVPDDSKLMTPYVLYEQEDWFEDEIRFLRKMARPGMRVIDIGANHGVYSLALARAAGETGRILAVEPCAATANHLRDSVAINAFRQVLIVQAALSNREGTAHLQTGSNSELNSLVTGNRSIGSTEEVNLTTLDRLVEDHDFGMVDLVKMDAEGEEIRIIEGATRFLRTQSPLVMYEIKSGTTVNRDLIDAFAVHEYHSYRLVPGIGLLAPFGSADPLEEYQLNLFCCKRDRAEKLAADGYLALEENLKDTIPRSETWWGDELSTRPFARVLRETWRTSFQVSEPQGSEYASIIAFYGAAHDAGLDPANRLAALRTAFGKSAALWREDDDVWRLSTYARVAREFGERQFALGIISKALRLLAKNSPSASRVPFLPASEHFDAIDPANKLTEWMLASLLDEGISLFQFSSFFAPPAILHDLEMLKSTGFQRPEMSRRQQLMKTRARFPAGMGIEFLRRLPNPA